MNITVKKFFPLSKENTIQNLFITQTLFETISFYKRKKLNFIFDSDNINNMLKSIKLSKMVVLVAFKKDKLIGFVTFRDSGEHDDTDREVQIFILPKWRFRGHGTNILLEAEYFIFKNHKKIKTLSANPSNPQVESILINAYWESCCGGDCGDFRKFIR